MRRGRPGTPAAMPVLGLALALLPVLTAAPAVALPGPAQPAARQPATEPAATQPAPEQPESEQPAPDQPAQEQPRPAFAQPEHWLAPGVHYRTLTRGESHVYVARVDLAAASSVEPALGQGRLAGFEQTSSMARRAGAVLAVNGDFGLPSGRPVHAFAAGGVLAQTAQLPGRGLALTRSGGHARVGFPDVRTAVGKGDLRLPVVRWNSGAPAGEEVAGFTMAGAGLEVAPDHACYATLTARGAPHVDHGLVRTAMTVRTGCAAQAPVVPADGALLVARQGSRAAGRLTALPRRASLEQALGFGGAWSLIGASEALVVHGAVNHADVDAPGAYVQDPAPRTAVGLRADGSLLLVVVDGRQAGGSRGLNLLQLARLLVDLGARSAVNLDGGGSSTMVVRGQVVNVPSDGAERAVDSALLVLPGSAPAGAAAEPADPIAAGQAAAHDPASTGGLLQTLGDLRADLG